VVRLDIIVFAIGIFLEFKLNDAFFGGDNGFQAAGFSNVFQFGQHSQTVRFSKLRKFC
jgi:hypothetical protein